MHCGMATKAVTVHTKPFTIGQVVLIKTAAAGTDDPRTSCLAGFASSSLHATLRGGFTVSAQIAPILHVHRDIDRQTQNRSACIAQTEPIRCSGRREGEEQGHKNKERKEKQKRGQKKQTKKRKRFVERAKDNVTNATLFCCNLGPTRILLRATRR